MNRPSTPGNRRRSRVPSGVAAGAGVRLGWGGRGLAAWLAAGLFLAHVTQAAPRIPWSYRPVANPPVPKVLNVRWPADDVDRFILARLEARQLAPNPDADRHTLLRRATFDLTGLPPTAGELAAFINDPAPPDRAFARVVDRLLDSPRFGERWARHWLDVVRYADSVGRAWNAPFIYAFRYRDYVIDSLNADKPYDRFVREQIAGDLLPAQTAAGRREQLVATGLLALGSVELIQPLGDEFLLERVDDQIDVTTRAFLGLTVSCARCHDHKYEPIQQRDYYALAGIFWSTETFPGQRNRGGAGPSGYVDQELTLMLPAVNSADTASPSIKRTPRSAASVAAMPPAMMSHTKDGQWTGIHGYDANRAIGVGDGAMENCAIRVKGEPYQRGEVVPRGALNLPGLPPLPAIPANASGRRQFADWITSRENPLTARVVVNRVWQHLFGRGIVITVDDFGVSGEPPTYPELLDHLATRLMNDGWSLKRLIRALVLSRAYRMSSDTNPNSALADGANENLWRMEARRLEVEAIRDALLQVGGSLRFERPEGIQIAGNGGKGRYGRTRSLLDEHSPYRTIYLPILRDLVPEMQQVFDLPNPTQIKGQREVTTVPPQALFLLNHELPARSARGLAARLLQEPRPRDDSARAQSAWLAVLGRPAAPEEVRAALAFMRGLESGSGADAAYRWTALVQSLLAATEFRYVR